MPIHNKQFNQSEARAVDLEKCFFVESTGFANDKLEIDLFAASRVNRIVI